jgi:MFS family permease
MKALGSRPISVLLPQLIQWANIQSVHRAGFHADCLLAIIFTLTHTALNAIVVHEIPFIEDMGVSKVLAATALGTMTLMSAPGRLFGGWLADKWKLKYLYLIASVVQAAGLFILSRVTKYVMGLGFCSHLRIELRSAYPPRASDES